MVRAALTSTSICRPVNLNQPAGTNETFGSASGPAAEARDDPPLQILFHWRTRLIHSPVTDDGTTENQYMSFDDTRKAIDMEGHHNNTHSSIDPPDLEKYVL
jgi:hypothetical protein